jgi:HPt (histidine-containing phosphotransfer) domain-containing protein
MLGRWLQGGNSSSRESAPGDEYLVDFDRIEEFVGDAECMGEVMAEFEAAALADITLLRNRIAQNDGHAACRFAHRLKGAALTIGARRLAVAAEGVERALSAHDPEQTIASVEGLQQELEQLLAAMKERKEFAVASH